jgi:methionine-rich copper-binding protein CopC
MSLVLVRKLYANRVAYALFALAVLVCIPAAFAHTSPVEMTPAAGSTVSAPASIMIRFSAALEPKFSLITVTNAAGHVVNKETSVCAADKLSMGVALPPLPPGV